MARHAYLRHKHYRLFLRVIRFDPVHEIDLTNTYCDLRIVNMGEPDQHRPAVSRFSEGVIRTSTKPLPPHTRTWQDTFDVGVTEPDSKVVAIRVKQKASRLLIRKTLGSCALSLCGLRLGKQAMQWMDVLDKDTHVVGRVQIQLIVSPDEYRSHMHSNQDEVHARNHSNDHLNATSRTANIIKYDPHQAMQKLVDKYERKAKPSRGGNRCSDVTNSSSYKHLDGNQSTVHSPERSSFHV